MSLLYSPIESRPELLARLYLHGVLPSLVDLLEFYAEAKAILGDRSFVLRIRAEALISDLSFQDGACHFLKESGLSPAIVLRFFSCRQLNRQFSGHGFTLPLPVRGAWRIGALRTFTSLSRCLKTTLVPNFEPSGADDVLALERYLHLSFSVALASTSVLIEHEEFAHRLFSGMEDWMVMVRVDGTDICGWVRRDGGCFEWGRGVPAGRSSAELSFRDTRVALKALAGNFDNFAAVNEGAIRLSGFAPLADKFGLVMDRVQAYIDT